MDIRGWGSLVILTLKIRSTVLISQVFTLKIRMTVLLAKPSFYSE